MARIPHSSGPTRLVLQALLTRQPHEVYGYQLLDTTGLRSGTLYPILRRLSAQGYLEERWDATSPPGVPPRRLYRLSAQGLILIREHGGHQPQAAE